MEMNKRDKPVIRVWTGPTGKVWWFKKIYEGEILFKQKKDKHWKLVKVQRKTVRDILNKVCGELK